METKHEYTDEVRHCSICGAEMYEGYVYDAGLKYFCSDDCLNMVFSDEEWEEECESNEDSYWTMWD